MAKILKRWFTMKNIKDTRIVVKLQPRDYGYQQYLKKVVAKNIKEANNEKDKM